MVIIQTIKLTIMKRSIFFLSLLVAFALQNQAQTLIDIDGNIYHTIIFGNQVWMSENLKVTHYRNGDTIPNITDNTQWSNLSSGGYCNYANDTNKTTLYNWFAAADIRNIAPAGWHVPSDTEWSTLTTYLGGDNVAGGILESNGFVATGSRNANGGFEYPDYGDWWASTASGTTNGCHRGHPNGVAPIYDIGFNKKYGFAVRLVKDNGTLMETRTKKSSLIIYPNPTNGKFDVLLDAPVDNILIEIINIDGQRIFSNTFHTITDSMIDLSDNHSGIYLVNVTTNNGTICSKLSLTK
jgi:uncharacterized protein (TIGR02145 family)